MGAGTPVLEPVAEVRSRLAGLSINPKPGNGIFNAYGRQFGSFAPMPGTSNTGRALALSEGPNARQDRCQAVAERWHFNKTLASLNANNVLQGKGRKNRRSAPIKTLLRRSQSRPNHWLGETYADHVFTASSCIVGPSLLAILLVVRGQFAE